MTRKGNQQKNGLNHKKGASGGVLPAMKGHAKEGQAKVFPGEDLPNGNQPSSHSVNASKTSFSGDETNNERKSEKCLRKEKQGSGANQDPEELMSFGSNSGIGNDNNGVPRQEGNGMPPSNQGQQTRKSELIHLLNGLHIKNVVQKADLADNVIIKRLRSSVSSIFTAAPGWLMRWKPFFVSLTGSISSAHNKFRMKLELAYPVVLKWFIHFGNLMLLISVLWLDCALRGIDSFVLMGTTSFFSVIWCSIFSVIIMIGMLRFFIVLALATLIGFVIGLTLAILVVAVLGVVFLWLYGSFWTTAFFIFLAGLAFMLSHERVALLVTTVYSVYCAWTYVGWFGLLLALNFSFISSDVLIYYLKHHGSHHRRSSGSSEQRAGMQGQQAFSSDEPMQASSETGPGSSSDRCAGVPSTSGADSEITSEDEVVRLLNCSDHYAVLGLSQYQNIDVSLLRREYRKKAMLVHPDKNMGNEKAAEAFKKLQNAYEVLKDPVKQKAYDDELRREELLSVFRRFQNDCHKNGRHGFFATDAEGEDPFGHARRVACKKCGSFHVWIDTKKQKSQARWCQECEEFHQAKDGDGWVEQSFRPFLFGLLQKVEASCAYVCADSKVYDATEWYICQGMRCPVNTHKPSFQVNASVISKHGFGKGTSSGQRGGWMPPPNMEETMTEEEFYEWLQNAAQAGVFDNFGGNAAAERPSTKAGNGNKTDGSGSSSNKRKKKGRKQR